MITEEELFVNFINEHHSDEAMEIASDPLLYIYYRDSIEFAVYKICYHRDILFLSVCKLFRIDKICNVISKWIKMNRFKLWNEWRKHNMDGPWFHFLVLIGFVKSPSFIGWCRYFREEEEKNE